MGNEIFRLLEVRLGEHQPLKDLDVELAKNTISELPFTSVVIGTNGSGKSYLLRTIIDIFRELESLKKGDSKKKNFVRGGFFIKYCCGIDVYSVEKGNSKKVIYKCGEVEINIDKLLLPSAIIANSVLLNDRFPVLKDDASEIYKYQGIKRTPSSGGTKSHLKRTVFGLLNNISENNFLNRIQKILSLIEYEKKCVISFYPRYKEEVFKGDLSVGDFKKHFNNLAKRKKRKSLAWSVGVYNKIKHDTKLIDQLVKLLRKISKYFRKLNNRGSTKYFTFDIFASTFTRTELQHFEQLYELDLLSEPSIELTKKQSSDSQTISNEFNIEGSSAGEYHLLASLISIATTITPKSLILIDEPEISLHPNWQMRYIDFLKTMFQDYNNCHFLITTHSHFIVSDLAKESSALIHMYNNKGKISAELVPGSTYGWSAEDVLYNVFDVVTTRNSYVAEEVGAILDRLSKGDANKENILDRPTYDKLKYLQKSLKENDPLKTVVNSILNHIEV